MAIVLRAVIVAAAVSAISACAVTDCTQKMKEIVSGLHLTPDADTLYFRCQDATTKVPSCRRDGCTSPETPAYQVGTAGEIGYNSLAACEVALAPWYTRCIHPGIDGRSCRHYACLDTEIEATYRSWYDLNECNAFAGGYVICRDSTNADNDHCREDYYQCPFDTPTSVWYATLEECNDKL